MVHKLGTVLQMTVQSQATVSLTTAAPHLTFRKDGVDVTLMVSHMQERLLS